MSTEHPHDDHDDGRAGDAPTADEAAMARLRAARYWIAARCPYYTTALYRCALGTTAHVPAVAVDAHWRIWANPAHVNTLTVAQTAVELIHALNHLLRSHHQRARHAAGDALLAAVWNMAADCEINHNLLRGLPHGTAELPEHWPEPWSLHLRVHGTAEDYYRQLLDRARVEPATGDIACTDPISDDTLPLHTDCGSGATGITPAWEPAPDADTPTRLEAQMLRRRTAQAAIDHNHRHPDEVPRGLLRWARSQLHPKIDWRHTLAAVLRRAAHHRRGDADYTWTRPPRRPNHTSTHGQILRPATTQPAPSLAVVVDTSGSMNADQHAQAVAEIDAICRHVTAGDHIDYYAVDTRIQAHQRITDTRNLPLNGGGTDMAQGITHANRTRPDAIIVLTDGHTPWPHQPPPGNPTVIAALIGAHAPTETVPKWMHTNRID